MSLSVQVFNSPQKSILLADFSRYRVPEFSTGEHGYGSCTQFVPMTFRRATMVMDWPETPHVVLSGRWANEVWSGRLEQAWYENGGLRWVAFGYWQALRDVPYTALWSVTDLRGWNVLTVNELPSVATPEKWVLQNGGGALYFASKKSETFTASTIGGFYYRTPHNGKRLIVKLDFNYSFTASSNWKIAVNEYDSAWGSASQIWSLTGDGTTQAGSVSITVASKSILLIYFYRLSSGTYTNDTGVHNANITNIRIKTTSSSTVLASAIASALVAYVNGVNSSQLNSSTALIEATTDDLQDEIYEDAVPSDILDRLALLHGYEVGVRKDRMLFFRPKGSAGRHWYINATRVTDFGKDISQVFNEVYGIYQDANGRTLRTAVAANEFQKEAMGITRRQSVQLQTTSSTQAEAHRDARLDDIDNLNVAATIEFDRLFDAFGNRHNEYEMNAGDMVTIRNLPLPTGSIVDKLREFRLAGTQWRGPGMMILEAEVPAPSLVVLVAQQKAGTR